MYSNISIVLLLLLLLLPWLLRIQRPYCCWQIASSVVAAQEVQPPLNQHQQQQQYLVLGVSGGLQDGFPERSRLDYTYTYGTYHSSGNDDTDREVVVKKKRAIFLGRALVRGYKAYLDVMQDGWRQYAPEPDQPLINSNVFATGCWEHANEYWIYLVDVRQVLTVLLREPRFLGISADTGQLELYANETSAVVRKLVQTEIQRLGGSNETMELQHVAIPLVTAVWFQPDESHVASPPIRIHDDDVGTEVTNFPESLALWAGVNDSDRILATPVTDAATTEGSSSLQKQSTTTDADANELAAARRAAHERYWNGIRRAIRTAEQERDTKLNQRRRRRRKQQWRWWRPWQRRQRQQLQYGLPSFACKKRARFGVSNEMAQINYPLSETHVTKVLDAIGYTVNYDTGKIYPKVSNDDNSNETEHAKGNDERHQRNEL